MKNIAVPADNRARFNQNIGANYRAFSYPSLGANGGERAHLDSLGQFGIRVNDCTGVNSHVLKGKTVHD
jgi:hypothetical protein